MATGWLDMSTIMEGLMDAPLGGQSSKIPDTSKEIQAEHIRAAIERVSARRQALKASGRSLADERSTQGDAQAQQIRNKLIPDGVQAPSPLEALATEIRPFEAHTAQN